MSIKTDYQTLKSKTGQRDVAQVALSREAAITRVCATDGAREGFTACLARRPAAWVNQ
jgi:hypothetical protein